MEESNVSNLIEKLIDEVEQIQFSDSDEILNTRLKISYELIRVFGSENFYSTNIKQIQFKPKTVFLEIAQDSMEASWHQGKSQLLDILAEAMKDTENLILIKPLKQVSSDRDITMGKLRDLLMKVENDEKNQFLSEAVKCFEVGAWRAAIVMVWNFTMDHMYEFVISNKLEAFNSVLANNNDRKIKISRVNQKEDFSEIPEVRFIEFCRSAGIISKDVRKILDNKRDTRNSFAHPSNIILTESKVIDVIEDLLNNVVFKFR